MICADVSGSGRPELDVLGRIALRQDGRDLRAILVQPKRVGLLTYLALRQPGGFVRRDELLGVFWPDSDDERARSSLRQALRFLRSRLGEGIVVNRGNADVGIEPGALGCDALDFLHALDTGEHERALERYGGDLMPGFFLDGVYEFDRWLHGERQRLRSLAIRSALRLASEAESGGDPAAGAEWARWALRHEAANEAVGRRLVSLLVETGNRAAAIEACDALEHRLRDVFDVDPSPETATLFAAVRDGRGAGHGTAGIPSAARGLSPSRVLVAGMENLTGDPDLDALGRLAADSVAQGLASIRELEVVPPMAVGARSEGAITEHAMADIARDTGAGTVVGGAYYLAGDSLRFQVRITDLVHDRLMQAPDTVLVERDAPIPGVQRLQERVMTVLGPALTRRVVHVRRAAPPPGMAAFRAYLDGLELFIRGEWRPALARFRHSADLEPEYALPRIVASIALWNLGELTDAEAVATEANELRPYLGRFERAVLDMAFAWLRGDWAAAHAAAEVQAEMAPGSIPHFQVAEEARRLNRPREAREVLSALDPEAGELRGWIYYWVELAVACHLMGDHDRELEVASRCRRLHPDDPIADLLEMRALAALGRHNELARRMEQILASPGPRDPSAGAIMREVALELQAHGWPDAASALFEQAVAWYEDRAGDETSRAICRDRARALYSAGRHTESRRLFEDLVSETPGRVRPVGHHHRHLQAHLDEGYLALIAAATGDAAEMERWCACLSEMEGPFLYGAQWFWLAAVAAVVDDEVRAVRMLRRAMADGLPMEMFVHADPHLGRLRGYASFDALVKPRG